MSAWWRNRNIQAVLWVSFFSILGYGAQRTVLTWHLSSLNIDPAMIGVLLSFFGLPRALMNVVGGYLTDTFSRKINLLLGIGIQAVAGYILLAFSSTAGAVAGSRVFIGLGLAWGTTAAMAILSDYSEPGIRGTVFGIQKGFFWVGIALSGYLGALYYPQWGLAPIMLASAVLGLLSLVLIAMLMDPVTPREQDLRNNMSRPDWLKTIRMLTTDRRYLALSLVGFMAKILEDGLVIAMFPIFFAGSVAAAGLSVTAFTVAFAIFQPLGGAASDRLGRKTVIVTGTFIALIGTFLLWGEPGTSGIVLSSALMGIGVAILSPTAEALAGDLAADALRGTSIGYWRFQRDLGSFFGPLVLPWLGVLFGMTAVLAGLFAALFLSGIMCVIWLNN